MNSSADNSESEAALARKRRFGLGEWLLLAGLVLYVTSMFLPVIVLKIFTQEQIVGWEAAWLCVAGLFEELASAPSVVTAEWLWAFAGLQCNLCFLAGWTFVWWKRPTVRWLTVGTFATAAVLAILIPALIAGEGDSVWDVYRELMGGYYVWTLSFLLMTIGAAVRLRSVERLTDSC